MIVRSIRLLNIKSYGEGPDGNGVTVHFERGVNRIAGKNGYGKSTLIESLGYALFLTNPIYEEKFDIATYLIRSGKKAAEIDVVFEMNGQQYRLERGLGGQSRRLSKVVLLADGSTEAEGDQQVSNYMCRLCGFSDQDRFSELFTKLIGVKQGRLTWPFDSKPTEAKNHFEPLLDVEIFRQCFDRLKPVKNRFEEIKTAGEREVATLEERIRDRADGEKQVRLLTVAIAEREKQVEATRAAKTAAEERRKTLERQDQSFRETESALQKALHDRDLAANATQERQLRLNESQDAAALMAAAQAGCQAYEAAELELRRLQQRQAEKSRLEQEKAAAINTRTQLESQAGTARKLRENSARQHAAKSDQLARLKTQMTERQSALGQSRIRLEQFKTATDNARTSHEALTKRLAAAEKLRDALATQLNRIAGGECPFLHEQCRQFDPGKVKADLSTHEKEIDGLRKENDEAARTHRQAQESFDKLQRESAELEHFLKSKQDTVGELESEIKELATQVSSHEAGERKAVAEAAVIEKDIAGFEEKLKAFSTLDREVRDQETAKERHSADHKKYLGSKAVADQLGERTSALKSAAEVEAAAAARARAKQAARNAAARDFDRAAMDATRLKLDDLTARLAKETEQLETAKSELQRARTRFTEWEAARQDLAKKMAAREKIDACIDLTETARNVLKNAAPNVARQVCARIAQRAQQIFNQINSDPIEVEWNSERYSLRINPGERRFAMLSGGEQTKLALAMTLAMIQEFCGLKFCVFDEPTYGVDADSRSRLADAIVRLQDLGENNFDQVLLVSHDDAFEGKIEHVISIQRTAARGSEPVSVS